MKELQEHTRPREGEQGRFSSNAEAERGLLGLILWSNSAFDAAVPLVQAEDFSCTTHRQLYQGMHFLSEKGESIDPVTLAEVMERHHDAHGGDILSDLYRLQDREMQLIHFDPVHIRAETYARTIAQHAEHNRLAEAALHILELARAGVEDATEQAEALVMGVRNRRRRQDFVSVADYFPKYLERLDALQTGHGAHARGVPTGYDDLDHLIAGFQRGDLYIPAARTGVGKTTLCQNFAYNGASKHGKRFGFVSLEMNIDALMDRFISIDSKIDSQRLRNGTITQDEHNHLVDEVMTRFESLGIWINHTPGITMDTLKSMARTLVAQHAIDVLIVDYLQLLKVMVNGRRVTPRAEEVAEIARQLKELAGELSIPIIAPAQISREVERRAGIQVEGQNLTYKMPVLSDLRESGEIEQSCDVAMMMSRSEEDESRVKLHVAKHRMGPVGELDLYFRGSENRFYPM